MAYEQKEAYSWGARYSFDIYTILLCKVTGKTWASTVFPGFCLARLGHMSKVWAGRQLWVGVFLESLGPSACFCFPASPDSLLCAPLERGYMLPFCVLVCFLYFSWTLRKRTVYSTLAPWLDFYGFVTPRSYACHTWPGEPSAPTRSPLDLRMVDRLRGGGAKRGSGGSH
ncbi:hypothetical protein BGZ61DRAFT_233835 [Ilyonectria robusta]|uniref:uncharacterized protein n=1 Tax=Ilyonectria robusta TaxID=1079257 RepID=UPI001E8CE545|nr:uncharacterized protein BGZ61DRAFT_233835 [Ilyonectria robusta]KAH8699575.1 hypothetical protein BGZ61DRAFT_233835 [Ilyonectria robusta]